MGTPPRILRDDRETVPVWLARYKPGSRFPRTDFFRSRILYYPGSGTDGHPMRLFGSAHAIHCFVYADFGVRLEHIEHELAAVGDAGHPHGYKLIHSAKLEENDVLPSTWTRHDLPPPQEPDFARGGLNGNWYYFWAVLERLDEYGENHGPKRLALLHVGREAVEAFDALFCQPRQKLPYAVLLHDHGYGGNCWEKFGGPDGILWNLIKKTGERKTLPKWLLVAESNTQPWPGYSPVDQGVHPFRRGLWLKCDQSGRSKNSLYREKIRNSPETEEFRRRVLMFCTFCETHNHPEVAHSIMLDLSVMTHMPFYGERHGWPRRHLGVELAVQYVQLLHDYGQVSFARELLQRVTVQQHQLLRRIARRNGAGMQAIPDGPHGRGIWDHAIPTRVVRDAIAAMLETGDIGGVRDLLEVYIRGGQHKLTSEEDREVAREYKDRMPAGWDWRSVDCDVLARYRAAGIWRFTPGNV